MSSPNRPPRAYRGGAWTRLVEGLRYGGGVGQWSWLIHRVTGLGVLLFLVIHVIDTFFVVAYPALYDHTVAIYGGTVSGLPDSWGVNGYYWPLRWAFRVGELGLIACVLFHAINGIRVVMFDFVPGSVAHQQALFRLVGVVFLILMIPCAIVVLTPLLGPPKPHVTVPSATAPEVVSNQG